MGGKEGTLGCGWFDGWIIWVDEASGGDMELADLKSKIELQRLYRHYISHPFEAAGFFHQKLASEWLDPSFQSFEPGFYEKILDEEGRLVNGGPFASLYHGALHDALLVWMDTFQSLVYLAALAFVLGQCFEKQAGKKVPLYALLPLVVFLGGFFFYLFWEAKGRYCLPFFLMLLPAAACGVPVLWQALRAIFARAAGAAGRLLGRETPAKDPNAPAREN